MSERRHGVPGNAPPHHLRELAYWMLEPARRLANPHFEGFERVPDHQRLLFVGNHTLYGVLDAPLLAVELHRQCGLWLRALGDHLHFKVPLWREFLTTFGVAEGTRAHCRELMGQGEPILVFPGGGREVAKRKGELYQLVWKERMGFARMAAEFGYTIVPFAMVGVEDAYDIVLDADELLQTPVGPVIEALGVRTDVIMPLATGIGPTLVPRPYRQYFCIGEPIDASPLADQIDDDEAIWALREQVRVAVESGIASLRARQAEDPQRVRFPELFEPPTSGSRRAS